MQHVEIYLPCNFEVNPITHFGVIVLFSSKFQNFMKVLKFKKFDEKRATTPRWVIRFTSKLQGR
jgi:hypothetical protein